MYKNGINAYKTREMLLIPCVVWAALLRCMLLGKYNPTMILIFFLK